MLVPAPGISANHDGPVSLLVIDEGMDTRHSGQLVHLTQVPYSLLLETQARNVPFPASERDI